MMKLTHTNLLNHLKTISDEHQKELEQGNYNMNIVVGLYDKVISDIKEKFGDSDEWKEIKYHDIKEDCENYRSSQAHCEHRSQIIQMKKSPHGDSFFMAVLK